MKTLGYAALSPSSPLQPFTFERREPGPQDVELEILYCGVCHSDLHQARNEWQNTIYPCMPGHEILGRVSRVGKDVTRFKPGQLGAVGCLVDSCRTCPGCQEGLEQFCDGPACFTYNGEDKKHGGAITLGGYSQRVVVDEHFVLSVRDGLDPASTAPLLCAGITTYSPMRHWKVSKGQKVGVVGLGGLGHMGVKFSHALGAGTVLFTHTPGKAQEAVRLGADEVVISSRPEEMEKQAGSFDFILDTVSAQHDLNAYLNLLKRDGTLVLVGAPENPLPVAAFSLIFRRRNFAGSLIGGIRETQEMLDFCADHGITSDIERISMHEINQAYTRLLKSDVRYRFVIDMATLG